MCHNHNGAGKIVELESIKRNSCKLQVRAAALLLRPQQDHSGVSSGRMPAEIGKTLVRRNQPASLILNARPELIVGHSLPALPQNSRRVITPSGHEVGNLPRQVLVDLNVRGHRPLAR